MRRLALLLPLLPLLPMVVLAGEPFRALDVAAACVVAQHERRLVMIEFTAPGCAACAELERTTWRDRTVADWLASATVAISVDGEGEPALARRFQVDAYPTVLFIAASGAIRDRLVGGRTAETFLAEARAIVAGRDAVTRASEVVERDAADPRAQLLLGTCLTQVGRYDEALAAYRVAAAYGPRLDGDFASERRGVLLPAMVRLGPRHPATQSALQEWRGAAWQRLLAGTGDARGDVADLIAIDQAVHEPVRTLAAFDALIALPPPGRPEIVEVLLHSVLDQLVAARRYPEVVAHQRDIPGLVAGEISRLRLALTTVASEPTPSPGAVAGRRRQVLALAGGFYESLVGAGRGAEAAQVGDHVLAFDASASQVVALIDHAVRAGDTSAAQSIGMRGLGLAQGGDRMLIRRALARLTAGK